MAGLTAPPDDFVPEGTTIAADGWFPPIETDAIRQTIRIGEGTVSDARLQAAIEGAMLAAMRELSAWRTARVLDGKEALAEVTEEQLNGRNLAEAIWERIIRFHTAAELADGHVDVSATDEAIDRAEEKASAGDRYRRMAHAAVADLRALGLSADGPEGTESHGRNRVSLL